MDSNGATINGKYNKLEMVNPYNCFFIARYANNKIIKGNNLIDTGWDKLDDGIEKLSYKLSTGRVIEIPKFKAYLHLVEVSQTLETGTVIFHSVNIKGLTDTDIINYKIILKQDNISKHKIGDVIITKENKTAKSPYWKMSA